MGKKLAIKGHPTRGKEVIEILQMIGGERPLIIDGYKVSGYEPFNLYYINDNGVINYKHHSLNKDMIIFTLEEFLEKYSYKLNDLVLCDDGLLGVVTKMEWDCEKSDMKYHISFKIPIDNKWYSSKNIICKHMESMEAKRKKLAIKGHPTRGKEVIELLEMLGGSNDEGYIGTNTWKDEYYFLDNGHIHAYDWCDGIKFTLEEFWEKYPFKIGDKVIDEADGCTGVVCEMKWDEYLSDMKYCVAFGNGVDFGWYANDSINFFKIKKNENLEETQSNQDIDKVVDIFRKEFCECCGSQRCSGQGDELVYCERFKNLIDNLEKTSVKNHKMGPKSKLPSKYYEEIQTKRDMDETMFMIGPVMVPDIVDNNLEYNIIDGYEFDKVENNKIILKPIKPQYPKTYKECCEKINACPTVDISYNSNEDMLYNDEVDLTLLALRKLLICRNVYWKIAGEEMGLDKPWEPDWMDTTNIKYAIIYYHNNVKKVYYHIENCILAFPTVEMRDAFYENFKDLIEQCKELL